MSLQHNGSAVDGGQSSAAAAHQQAAAAAAAMQTAMVDLQQQQQQPSVADLQAAASANCAAPGANAANASQLSSSPSSSVLELRCLLDNASVGGIIGRGGACVAVVREQSGAVVSIVKADTRHAPERIMILKGHAQQIAVAAKCCAQLYKHTAHGRDDSDATSCGRRSGGRENVSTRTDRSPIQTPQRNSHNNTWTQFIIHSPVCTRYCALCCLPLGVAVLRCCTGSLLEAASRREEHPVETASLRLLIHKTGVGAIIGRAGATIKVKCNHVAQSQRMRTRTHAWGWRVGGRRR